MKYNKSITATVYIVHEDKILLHMHKKYNTWFPVGGHIESDEFPHEAAIREAKEETGLDIKLLPTENYGFYNIGRVERIPLPFCLYHEGDDEDFFDFIYIAKPITFEINPSKNESTELKWFSYNDLQTESIKQHVRNTAIAVLDYTKLRYNNGKI